MVLCDGFIAVDNGRRGWCINENVELFHSVSMLVLSPVSC